MAASIPGVPSFIVRKMINAVYINLGKRPCVRRTDWIEGQTFCFGRCRDCSKRRIASAIMLDFMRDHRFNGDDEEDEVINGKETKEILDELQARARPTSDLTPAEVEQRIRNLQAKYFKDPEFLAEAEDDDEGKKTSIINEQGAFGYTQLHKAVKARNLRVVKLLIEEQNADPDIKDNAGNTPYAMAVIEGYDEIVRYFRSAGIVS